ncbi:prolipoprotein diacylglyceryl transferase [Peptoniphilus catoniae]|uniref:prolipoprotein diacylglyceryl transferase n=1 Tax=Peptoniphilus catoniae TaxID=1660341 RepID=UPI0010FEC0C9|nr:prolipoprotein diacylglyceryl transferase [Peptoniphilus catoniae]
MNFNPVAFRIFNIDVMWYGILIGLGVLVGIFLADRLANKEGYYNGMITDLATFLIIFGVIGARLYYVVFSWDYYSKNLIEIFAIRNGGLAIYGGVFAGIIVTYIFSKNKNIPFFKLADILVPSLAFGQGIGRWGNFINGEAHGGPTSLPWAINVDGVMVHPTFLYESILDFATFLFLYFYLYKNKKFEGHVFSFYMILYGLGRFFIEGLRTDSLYIGPFRVSQLVSLVFVFVGVILLIKNKENLKK